MISKKDRRHSGRKYTIIPHPENYPYEEEKYNEWNNYRDGIRNPIDRSKIRPIRGISQYFIKTCHIYSDNIKLKRKRLIRKIQKLKMEDLG